MTTQAIPLEARIAADATCGDATVLEPVTDRRGCAVWKATGPLRSAAVKCGAGPEGTVIVLRESAAVAGILGGSAVMAQGRNPGEAWMITAWHDGPSTSQLLAGVRDGTTDLGAARDAMVAACEAVAALHAAGWVHGDIQPEHMVHTPAGVRFLDCSWAWHPLTLGPSRLFRGGMPHLIAPELAWRVHRGHRPVVVTSTDEVYTLAASLWWAIADEWPLSYVEAGVDPSALDGVGLRHAIATRGIPVRSATVWPAAQIVLSHVMSQPDYRRPSAADLAILLGTALDDEAAAPA
ncbi:protein kinase family protein [Actinacidiphila glaucinigra]|uniref:Protein kinase domain-containing protein n=1 Tax=Actinacidiphila glaucinigra TaxID=235986 RepID=A0A239MNS6_9ACTN|nr:hypothetical protein [Actinacidiphila glaucinigra]SNT44507.1 hypothetical protein SAMN05216252_12625 [Actinacidiphila glaucinigra]